MTTIRILPMPEKIRQIPKKWRPGRPPDPIFTDCGPGEPTREDFKIALEMFEALDIESQEYWGGEDMRDYLSEGIKGQNGGVTSENKEV